MEEFPGDDPANFPKDDVPFDLPRSPAKVLDQLGHTFKVRHLTEVSALCSDSFIYVHLDRHQRIWLPWPCNILQDVSTCLVDSSGKTIS